MELPKGSNAGVQARRQRLAQLLLLATAMVWGSTFVLVKAGLNDASPLLFNLIRMTLAAIALAIVNLRALRTLTRRQIAGGCSAGVLLAIGYQFQTFGLTLTTPAKSGFLTGLVVVFVPLLMLVPALRAPGTKRPGLLAGLGAALAFAGLLLLTTPAGTRVGELFAAIGLGDLMTLVCAVAFAGHMLTLSRVSPHVPAGVLATLQIAACAMLMLLSLPLERHPRLHLTPALLLAFAVTSLFATAAAFTIQSFAQKHLPATQTAVILTLEPVFAWLTSLLFLHDHLGARGGFGAALILAAILLIEVGPGLFHTTEIPA